MVFAAIALAGYVTDLVTKVLAVEHLTGKAPVPVVGDLLTLYLAPTPAPRSAPVRRTPSC